MTDTFFEIGFEGTSNKDCMTINKLKTDSILVFDNQNHYGTTLKSLEDLRFNKFIKNIKIFKNKSRILFETDPQFYRSNDEIINLINTRDCSSFVDFVPINRHYLILENGNYYKIPYTITDLVDTKFFTFKDRHLVNRFVKSEINIEELKIKLSDKCKQILLNGILGYYQDVEDKLKDYIENFEYYPFIYPKHGMKDISELLSRINAINGISYLLDSKIKVYEFKKMNFGQKDTKIIKKEIEKPPKKIKEKCSGNSTSACICEDEVDLFEKYNTNNDNDSDEIFEIEEVSSGQLYTNERQCCLDKMNSSSLILCSGNAAEEDDFGPLMDILNAPASCPDPLFFQGEDFKIQIEDITLRNQIFDYRNEPNEKVKKLFTEMKFDFQTTNHYINQGYKYFIKSEHGNIFMKKIYKKEMTGTKKYIRIINLSYKLLKDRFFAWFYNGYEFLQVLVIDSNSKCCAKGTYIIYLIKEDKPVTNRDIEILNIHDCDIITDFAYQIYDYTHVEYS
ncbi:Rab GDP-dissociation inhibitor [Vairimorpha necatrix]|uniref:Rab GDP-dissociation inhibitor n=1 Tax=Vairimorpha necatrix TaxID=6039 RepID=A0AAX4J8Y1_9MICR